MPPENPRDTKTLKIVRMTNEYLSHAGVKGMRWKKGRKEGEEPSNTIPKNYVKDFYKQIQARYGNVTRATIAQYSAFLKNVKGTQRSGRQAISNMKEGGNVEQNVNKGRSAIAAALANARESGKMKDPVKAPEQHPKKVESTMPRADMTPTGPGSPIEPAGKGGSGGGGGGGGKGGGGGSGSGSGASESKKTDTTTETGPASKNLNEIANDLGMSERDVYDSLNKLQTSTYSQCRDDKIDSLVAGLFKRYGSAISDDMIASIAKKAGVDVEVVKGVIADLGNKGASADLNDTAKARVADEVVGILSNAAMKSVKADLASKPEHKALKLAVSKSNAGEEKVKKYVMDLNPNDPNSLLSSDADANTAWQAIIQSMTGSIKMEAIEEIAKTYKLETSDVQNVMQLLMTTSPASIYSGGYDGQIQSVASSLIAKIRGLMMADKLLF